MFAGLHTPTHTHTLYTVHIVSIWPTSVTPAFSEATLCLDLYLIIDCTSSVPGVYVSVSVCVVWGVRGVN